MTRSILDDVLGLEEKTVESLKAYFDSIGVQTFTPIYPLPDAYKIILFILCAYSEESPMLICNQDVYTEKNNICDKIGIPEYMRGTLFRMDQSVIRDAVKKYLLDFASAEFKNLQFLKINLMDVEDILAGKLCRKEVKEEEVVITTEFDDVTYRKLLEQSTRLAKDIAKAERELKTAKEYMYIENFFDGAQRDRKNESFSVEANRNIK